MNEQVDEARLPQISAALVLEAVGLEVTRDQFGMNHCRDRVIGPRRKKLGAAPTTPIFFAPPLGELHAMDPMEAMELARDQARVLLAGMCKVCPFKECKMKGWGLTIAPCVPRAVASHHTRSATT